MKIFEKVWVKLKIARRVSKFGANFYYQAKFFFFVLFEPIFSVINNSIFRFQIKIDNRIFFVYMSDRSDISVFDEVFVKEAYRIKLNKEPNVIFDLGSNSGFSVLYFKIKFPKALIYAFEPNLQIFNKLLLNCGQFSDVKCFNVAITDKEGEQDFFVNTKASLSSALVKRTGTDRVIKAKTRNLDSIIKEFKISQIDLLKFDIEGGEYNAFKEFHNLKIVNNLIGEVHLDLMNVSRDNFLDIFKSDFTLTEKTLSPKRFIINLKSK